MQPIAILAFGAVSPLGTGAAAVAVGALGERPVTRVERDARLALAGLLKPMAARAPVETPSGDRAQGLLSSVAEALSRELERVLPSFRERRLALAIGTSAGGMPSLERALSDMARGERVDAKAARSALYDGPLAALRPWFQGPAVQVLAACASSTVAMGLGARWLDAGHADIVIAGGYDALTDFVATGFEALGATTGSGLEPFRTNRDGMALGEGAALVALVRASDAEAALGYVLGFGATNDAVHVTAPDPDGRGLERAALLALEDAGLPPDAVELVSAHATATPHNDRAEARAMGRTLGAAAARVVVHPFKASIGHCLGASGILETLAALGAMREGILPAARGMGPVEPELGARLLETNQPGQADVCLKLSAGFAGSNAALVVQSSRPGRTRSARAMHDVRVDVVGELVREPLLSSLVSRSVVPEARLQRMSGAGALAATAIASTLAELPSRAATRTAIVVGTSAACIEENARFDRVRREQGPGAVEPRRFSRTSPNVPAGECAIAFGFSGPAFAVGGGPSAPLAALLAGYDLIASGDAERVFVVTCDEVESITTTLFSAAGLEAPAHGARAIVLGRDGAGRLLERGAVATELARGEHEAAGERLLVNAVGRATRGAS